jgi:hypothetical protein
MAMDVSGTCHFDKCLVIGMATQYPNEKTPPDTDPKSCANDCEMMMVLTLIALLLRHGCRCKKNAARFKPKQH